MKRKKWAKSLFLILLSAAVLISCLPLGALAAGEGLVLKNLKCDNTVNPLGMDNPTPAFSWQMESPQRGTVQTAYRIVVRSGGEDGAVVWDSGKVRSDLSVGVPYAGQTLQSAVRYTWMVTVWDNHGNQAVSEEAAWFETGLLEEADWQATWIQLTDDSTPSPTAYTVEMDFRIIQDAAGILFAAKDSSNYLMWQINTYDSKFGGITSFRPHKWTGGSVSKLAEFSIDSVIPVSAQGDWHHIRIAVDGSTVVTFIDDTKVDERQEAAASFGLLGFQQAATEQAAYDNIVVKDGDGKILFQENFDAGVNSYFGIGEVSDGVLTAAGGTGYQSDYTSSAPMYRKDFAVEKAVEKARIYASALGIYELEVNGVKVSDDLFNPGWTNYEWNQDDNNYVMYQTFDVTDLLQKGENVLGAITGHGWYSGKLFVGGNNRYGTGSKLLCQLVIDYTDGSRQVVATDASWRVSGAGPILSDDFQGGETYDANREMPGWSSPGFTEDSTWSPAEEAAYSGDVIAQIGPTVRVIEELQPVDIRRLEDGRCIVDLGQNISGFARMHVQGEAGTTVRLRFGEMLQADGSLYTENLRSAKATDLYTLKGKPGGETYQPRFTFHGFRYIEVTNYPGRLTSADITGLAISSLQTETGSFETSDPLVNQLQSNIQWGQRDNFISVPTDCPQRDERLGYTGDGQVFVRTASMNMDVSQFFKKFMLDVTSNQRENGAVADWTPNYVTAGDSKSGSFGNSGWGDAVVLIPWTMYTTYGDRTAITDNYDAMKAWVGWYENQCTGGSYIVDCSRYGDWLSVDASTPTKVVSTGYFAYCADLLSRMAAAIGKETDAAYYADLFRKICADFNRELVDADGHVSGQTQTAYLLALKFNLLPDAQTRAKAAAHLVEDIRAKNWHLSTGFLGVAYLCPVLTEMGYADVAYRLLLQESYPSWLYSVKAGATTIWERWDSYNAETGAFGSEGMNSFNHYSLGSVGEWLYNYVAGIQCDAETPGYKHFILQPTPGGGLDYVNGSFDSVYGRIESNWRYAEDDTFVLNVTVPANTTATIYIPADRAETVTEGDVAADQAEGVDFVGMENGKAVYTVGSGSYEFRSRANRYYMLTIEGADSAIAGTVWVNGEETALPAYVELAAGETVTLEAAPVNDVDYHFGGWSGDFASRSRKITLTAEGNLHLAVSFASNGFENLALGKSASSNNTYEVKPAWSIVHLTDGKLSKAEGNSGYTSQGVNSRDVSSSPIWVEVDLGRNTDFNRIHLYPRTASSTADSGVSGTPENYTVSVRGEGESDYRPVKTVTGQTFEHGTPAVLLLDGVENARYVRITVSRLGEKASDDVVYRLQLSELGIYYVTDRTVEAVTDLPEITVPAGTPFAALELPDSAEVRLSDGTTGRLAISWEVGAYNPASAGSYSLTGRLEVYGDIVNPKNIAPQVCVTVADPVLKGDMDFDGSVTVSDVVTLRQRIVSGGCTERELAAGDFDGDGNLTVSDVVALRSKIVRGE